MSHEYRRRGRNWFTAVGSLFIVMAAIVFIRQLILWGPEFVFDFIIDSEFTNEKVSLAMMIFGCFMIFMGFRKKHD